MIRQFYLLDGGLGVKVNGFSCKDATNITAMDFFFDGFMKLGLTNNTMGSLVIVVNV